MKKLAKIFLLLLLALNASGQGVTNLFFSNAGGVPTDNLQGYYPFNGNANDESGNSRNLSVVDAYIGDSLDRHGSTNSAYYFNGSTAYLYGSFSGAESSFSISFWVKTTDSGLNGIVGFSPSNGIRREVILNSTNTVRFYNGNYYITSNQINTGAWTHIVATYDDVSEVHNVYVDGVSQSLSMTSSTITRTANIINVGRFLGLASSTYYINGMIDDIYIYSRALTLDEVTALYND